MKKKRKEPTIDDLREENATLRQAITILAASFPSKLITGKVGEWWEAVARAVVTGEDLPSRKL